jgi:hypothetical protein
MIFATSVMDPDPATDPAPDPDPTIFVSDLNILIFLIFFYYFFCRCTFTSVFKDNKFLRSGNSRKGNLFIFSFFILRSSRVVRTSDCQCRSRNQCCESGMIFFRTGSGSDFSESFGSDPGSGSCVIFKII